MNEIYIFVLLIWNIVLTIAVIRMGTNVNGINDWIAENLPRFRRMYQDLIAREITQELSK